MNESRNKLKTKALEVLKFLNRNLVWNESYSFMSIIFIKL
jgi:hypothetical protein